MVKVVLISYGNRVRCYSQFVAKRDDAKIVAVVEPNEHRRNLAKKDFNLDEKDCYACLDDMLAKGKIADCAINGTMDQFHYETTMPLLEQGYHVLLEKPVTSNKQELLNLQATAQEKGVHLMICHLLRYTPFYGKIKELIEEGKMGEIMSIMASENVAVIHSSSAFIRGKWRKEAECGSSLLMAKCCHDLDYLCWLNNKTKPLYVSSFGGRDFLTEEKAPEGAGTRCLVDCPAQVEGKCQWSAYKDYVKNEFFNYYAFETIDKDLDKISVCERIKSLQTDNSHGTCAFKSDMDLVDHQMVNIKFENGSTAALNMTLGAYRPGRDIHILGTKGEIQGYLESNKFYYRQFDEVSGFYTEEVFDFNELDCVHYGHMGGDGLLVDDFIKIVSGETPSIAYTTINDSVNGHLCVYAADEARKTNKVVKVESI